MNNDAYKAQLDSFCSPILAGIFGENSNCDSFLGKRYSYRKVHRAER